MAQDWARTVLVVTAAVLVTEATNLADVPCGQQQILAARFKIVGGKAAYHGEHPWTVSLQQNGKHFCGGTIISSQYIITASHCLRRRSSGSVSVVAGEHDLTRAESSQRKYRVAQIIRHKGYRYPSFRDDIALLRLSDKIAWDQYRQPVCLPSSSPEHGDPATVAGWGWLGEYSKGGQPADVLQRADVPIVTRGTCSSWFRQAGRGIFIRRGQMCAGYKSGGVDGCQGDSGGPLVVRNGGKYTLVGLVSAGIGCARPNLPGIYTDIHEYMDWILRNAPGTGS